MSVKLLVMIMIGLLGGCLTILALADQLGGSWGDVASAVTTVIGLIGFFAIAVFAVLGRR